MLILDEVLYAADRGLLSETDVHDLIDAKPDGLKSSCYQATTPSRRT